MLIVALYALFASAFTLGKDALSVVPPIFFIGVRMTFAGSLLLLFLLIFDRKQVRIAWSEAWWFLGIVIFHIYGAYVAEYIALQYTTSSQACLLYNMSPFITALLAYVFFKERLNWTKFIGLIIGFMAFIPLIMRESDGSSFLSTISWPELLLVGAVTCSCIGWIFMKKLTHHYHHSYFFVNTIGMLVGGVLALITSSGCEVWPTTALLFDDVFLRALLGLILVANIICYNLYGYLLHRYSPTLLSFFGCITPLFGALFGWLFLQEQIVPMFWVTMGVAAIGLYLYYREELKLPSN